MGAVGNDHEGSTWQAGLIAAGPENCPPQWTIENIYVRVEGWVMDWGKKLVVASGDLDFESELDLKLKVTSSLYSFLFRHKECNISI